MGRPLPSTLEPALDAEVVAPAMGGFVQDFQGADARIREVSSRVVKNRTVRYTLQLDGAPTPTLRLIGKVFETRGEGEQSYRALQWLWTQGFAALPPHQIVVPRALAFLPELNLLIMEEAGGTSLKRRLRKGLADADEVRSFADALVKLHRFPARYGEPFTVDRHLELRCWGLCSSLAGDFPDLSPSIARIVVTARKTPQDEFSAACTAAHGDYHPGQIHLDGERIWLVDPDLLNHGDPAYDVAMSVLTLKGLGSNLGQAEAFQELVEVFLASYFSRMDRAIAERVPVNAALIFLKRACKRFRWQNEPNWQDSIRLQIQSGVECLALQESHRPPRDLPSLIELCGSCPPAT